MCPTCRQLFSDERTTCPADGTKLVGTQSKTIPRPAPGPHDVPTSFGRLNSGRLASSSSSSPSPSPAAAARPATEVADLTAVHQIAVGDLIGEYYVTAKIGEGGMGSVYAGIHPLIGKRVAIKVLNIGLSQDREIVDRFVQEARAVNQIAHRNIVDIFAFGQLQSGRHYCVMEFLDGMNLRSRLSRQPLLTHAEVFSLLHDVLDALTAAHGEGIVHRDLKPDNIFLIEEKSGTFRTKLLDFGVAKLLRRPSEIGLTRTSAPLGTPVYMAPEQCRNRAVDVRTDLYAMGVIMFEIFTGTLPFGGTDYIDTVNGHLSQPPPRPSEIAPMPPRLEALILRCLEKDPEKRPQSAAELDAELLQLAAEEGATSLSIPKPLRPDPSVASTSSLSSSVKSAIRPPTTRPQVIEPNWRTRAAVGLFALAVASVVAVAGKRLYLGAPSAIAPGPLALELRSEPAGASLFVDGQRQAAVTPATLSVARATEITVRLEKDGFAPIQETLRPAAGEARLTRSFTLVPSTGALAISTPAAHARWIVDGRLAAATGAALGIDALAPGVHAVRVEAVAFLPFQQDVQVQAGQTTTLAWTLTPMSPPKRRNPRSSAGLPDAPKSNFRP